MESAVLVLLASSMGVMFGWQPMPDGSQRYEYVVQIEPELAATLREGQSIPITSDIPADVGPIGRIRIVVGRDALPRQQLVTRHKPLAKKSAVGEIVETQYTVPPVESSGTGRYAAPNSTNNSQIFPPTEKSPAASNPFGRALQQGAQEARELAAEAKEQIFPPSNEQLFGATRQDVRGALNNTADRAQQGAQQFVDRTGQQVRQAIDDVAQRTRYSDNSFAGSADSNLSTFDNNQDQLVKTILPPNSPTENPTNNGQFAGNRQRIDQPGEQRQPGDLRQGLGTPPANLATTPPANDWASETRGSNPASGRYGNLAAPPLAPSGMKNQHDPFDVAHRQADGSPQHLARNAQTEINSASSGKGGLQFPRSENPEAESQEFDSGRLANSKPPEVRRNMLDRPVNLETPATDGSQPYRPRQQTVARHSLDGQPPLDGQPLETQSPENWPKTNPSSSSQGDSIANNNTVFPLLLSWVLLSGSGVGNVYLFWSYLDVRSKYQGVVHGSSSRLGRYND